VFENLRVFGQVGFFFAHCVQAAAGLVFAQRRKIMGTLEIVLLVVVVLFLFGGGGGYYYSRRAR
jgi:uncharacterized membrane protein YhhN